MSKSKNYTFNYSKEVYEKIMKENILNKNEKNCLKYLVKGLTCQEISIKLKCSERTIQNRRRSIYKKLNTIVIDEYKDFYETYEEKYYIYILIFPNKKYYIGKSLNPKKRWNNGNGYKNNEKMYVDIQKYGWENIEKRILYRNLTKEEAIQKENETIVIYKSYMEEFGYNETILI